MKKNSLNKTKLASVFVISCTLVIPSIASAIDFFSSNNPTYFGAGYGKTKYLGDIEGAAILKFDKKDTGFIGFVGKQYNKDMDIEGFYTKQGKYEEESGFIKQKRGSIKVTVIGAKVNYKFSQDSNFIPYATLGGANVDIKGSNLLNREFEDGFKFVFGGGVQHKYSKDITLRAEYLDTRATSFIWGGVSTSF
jgi:hypothetical protein